MRKLFVVFAGLCVLSAPPILAGPGRKIDADPNKRYRLTKRHGPWMIMVASMRDVPEERRSKHGLSAQQAADRLVLELRREGIPAYTFSQKQALDQVSTIARRSGEKSTRSYVAQQDRVVVVAGNYPSPTDETAQATLAYLKRTKDLRDGRKAFQARLSLLNDPESGAVYRHTPGRPGPLSRAFLMPNPLLSPDEIIGGRRDPLLIKLNSDMEHSLTACPGKYSLVVATFRGKSSMHVNRSILESSANKLDAKLGTTLDDAALNAWRMTQALRRARSVGYDRDFPAYVYHDRYQSIVTIGSFDSPTDPRIAMLTKQFKAKTRLHPKTGREVLTAEIFAVPRRPPRNQLPDYTWIFDPNPELIEVPRLK